MTIMLRRMSTIRDSLDNYETLSDADIQDLRVYFELRDQGANAAMKKFLEDFLRSHKTAISRTFDSKSKMSTFSAKLYKAVKQLDAKDKIRIAYSGLTIYIMKAEAKNV